ncbi:MAG: hypothetical protein IKO26_08975 [Paludibacteraceae bacterium]|nr:hypothetical protein [Paludibacteraceae bacterium]
MSAVHFLDPVDYISGKISKKYRTVYNRRRDSDKRYTQVRDARTTPPTSKEMAHHTKFKTCVQAANERSQDLMNMTQDQASYREARKLKGCKYHTFHGWLVGKAFEYYIEGSHSVVWPERL